MAELGLIASAPRAGARPSPNASLVGRAKPVARLDAASIDDPIPIRNPAPSAGHAAALIVAHLLAQDRDTSGFDRRAAVAAYGAADRMARPTPPRHEVIPPRSSSGHAVDLRA
ncbi:MAG: hypothetical protein H3C38_16935 [Rhodospirillales bacterium]|nr:hypothetical protein [Rhodospirillales bacterium]